MGFQQGLSGLSAASKNLDVIGHNIANANTTGYKSGRAEFSALYASSLSAAGGGGSGIGVTVGAVAQQYTQGNLSITGNDLDVAINGAGFYTLQLPDGTPAYSRDGAFKLDASGNIVNNSGAKLMGYPTDTAGVRQSIQTQPLSLPTSSENPPKQTTALTTQINLPANAVIASSATPPTPDTTYGTTFTAYDAQGLETPVGLYFVKTASNAWDVYAGFNGAAPTTTGVSVTFDSAGQLDAAGLTALQGLSLSVPDPQDASGATTYPVTLDMANSSFTQYNNKFTVSKLSQDGYTSGSLTGIKIEDNGVVTAKYSNGQTQAAGQIALANFPNVQGLAPQSGNMWTSTYTSGSPVMGSAGEGKFGKIQSGALEDSNVDLTAELVNMMTAQRNYQANAQTIKTMDQVMSTLVSMR